MYIHVLYHQVPTSLHRIILIIVVHGRVSTADIKETAGWDRSHAVASYLTDPVLSTISVVAGHVMNTYVMRRDRVPIPQELEDLVMPWVPDRLEMVTKVPSIPPIFFDLQAVQVDTQHNMVVT